MNCPEHGTDIDGNIWVRHPEWVLLQWENLATGEVRHKDSIRFVVRLKETS